SARCNALSPTGELCENHSVCASSCLQDFQGVSSYRGPWPLTEGLLSIANAPGLALLLLLRVGEEEEEVEEVEEMEEVEEEVVEEEVEEEEEEVVEEEEVEEEEEMEEEVEEEEEEEEVVEEEEVEEEEVVEEGVVVGHGKTVGPRDRERPTYPLQSPARRTQLGLSRCGQRHGPDRGRANHPGNMWAGGLQHTTPHR
ncbi:unnamed protein product, partial [Gadus morhua 'NCC']